ncbi:MAG TPA: MBL fold metallo-hydrolase [Dehalococcoidia bacterium]|nr:MBL fold metallo-hydrolase [Dehalococcoidia bacterium]
MPGHTVRLGDVEVISFTDVTMRFPWQVMFPNVPSAELEQYRDLYPECWSEVGFVTDAGAYAIRSSGKTIVVDTGLGPGPHAWLRNASGNLVGDMKAKGVDPADVDIVVHTHLHGDHVGWNVTDGVPTFPRARYMTPQKDWDYFNQVLHASPQITSQVSPIHEAGKLDFYDGESTITPEVTTIPSPGHTPGHSSILVNSGAEKLLVMGDVAHHPAQVDRPDWSPSFDVDPATSATTRKQMVERLIADNAIAAFCHFPGDGFGRIRESNGKRIFQAL